MKAAAQVRGRDAPRTPANWIRVFADRDARVQNSTWKRIRRKSAGDRQQNHNGMNDNVKAAGAPKKSKDADDERPFDAVAWTPLFLMAQRSAAPNFCRRRSLTVHCGTAQTL